MGTFVEFIGIEGVPEEKRAELLERMKAVFREGGYMRFHNVKLFDKEISLMYVPEVDADGRLAAFYNYFEDKSWEGFFYTPETQEIGGGKVGETQFCRVAMAACVLYEFYAEEFGLMTRNGNLIDSRAIIAWLNYLFDEKYTNIRVQDPWKVYRALNGNPDLREYDEEDIEEWWSGLTNADPDVQTYMPGYLKALWIHNRDDIGGNVEEKVEASEKAGSEPSILVRAASIKTAIHAVKEDGDGTDEEKVDRLKQILIDGDACECDEEDAYKVVRGLVFKIPSEMYLRFIASEFDLNYWDLLDEMDPYIIEDKKWAAGSPWEALADSPAECPPVEKRPTNWFLECSDDDRAYYWTPDGDVHFSEEMEQWMWELRREFDEILAQDNPLLPPMDFVRSIIDTLYDAAVSFRRVYGYRDMFYEFANRPDSKETQAAIILLKRLIERHREEGQVIYEYKLPSCYINAENPPWEDIPKDVKFNPARLKIRRYLAIMSNSELRQQIFGF